MAYVIVKRKKYLEGWNYASGFGYSFFWTTDMAKARRFADDDASVDSYAKETNGRLVHVKNACEELAREERLILAAMEGER